MFGRMNLKKKMVERKMENLPNGDDIRQADIY